MTSADREQQPSSTPTGEELNRELPTDYYAAETTTSRSLLTAGDSAFANTFSRSIEEPPEFYPDVDEAAWSASAAAEPEESWDYDASEVPPEYGEIGPPMVDPPFAVDPYAMETDAPQEEQKWSFDASECPVEGGVEDQASGGFSSCFSRWEKPLRGKQ